MRRITHGYTRTVYIIGALVFKVPSMRYGARGFVMGMFANIQERDIWQQSNHWDRLAPVYFSLPFGLMNLTKRFDDSVQDVSDADEFASRFINLDSKSDNYAYDKDGRLILIDYGNMNLYFVSDHAP